MKQKPKYFLPKTEKIAVAFPAPKVLRIPISRRRCEPFAMTHIDEIYTGYKKYKKRNAKNKYCRVLFTVTKPLLRL